MPKPQGHAVSEFVNMACERLANVQGLLLSSLLQVQMEDES